MDTLIAALAARGAAMRRSVADAGFIVSILLRSLGRLPDLRHRWRFVLDQLVVCGLSPLPVVCIVGLFTGMILSLQVGMELEKVGQAEAISNMIGLILFREMGPFMTAMILTASVGSAMAAEQGVEPLDRMLSTHGNCHDQAPEVRPRRLRKMPTLRAKETGQTVRYTADGNHAVVLPIRLSQQHPYRSETPHFLCPIRHQDEKRSV